MSKRNHALETVVPEAVYTDRQELIDYFYDAALKATSRRTMSTVLLGQRRMGKTEIFKRVVNRLFLNQDADDQNAVIPVFYQFPEEHVNRDNFSKIYIENFLKWFVAFRMKDQNLLRNLQNITELMNYAKKNLSMTNGLYMTIDLMKAILDKGSILPAQKAIMLPREVAYADDITIVMFLDEFQNTRLPHIDFSIVGFFQEAVESPTCPHFVTGSAMSILSDEILGKGALYGRFDYERIESFTDYYGEELVLKAANFYQASIPKTMAPVISDRCGGNPFYITSVVRQAAKQKKVITNEDVLNKMLAIDISTGFIWAELSDQVNRWIRRINEYDITKWILYIAALEEGDEIDLNRVQRDLKTYNFVDVPISKIQEVMIKLARGDLLEYKMFGNWFCKINDPILNEFLKVWGEIEVVKHQRKSIEEQTIRRFQKMERRFHEYKGYLSEVYMIQLLWSAQDMTLPGQYFHSKVDIKIPDRFIYIDQIHRQHVGKNIEVDIYASAATEIWLAESKWQLRPVGEDVVNHLIAHAKVVNQREGDDIDLLRLWLFSFSGVTQNAEAILRKQGILWSTKDDLNALLKYVNLRPLPELTPNGNHRP